MSTIEETVNFARRMESTGISALAIHGRQRPERPRQPCRENFILAVSDALTIPVLANGGSNDIVSFDTITKFQQNTKTAGVLVARAAMWNPSVFCASGPEDIFSIIPRYCELCLQYDFAYEVMKYTILQMLRDLQDKDPRGLETRSALSSRDIAAVWGIERVNSYPPTKRPRIDTDQGPYPYYRNNFTKSRKWPKMALDGFIRKNFEKKLKPEYRVTRREKDGRFSATMKLILESKEKVFTGGFERNKREAEQAAALQAVIELQIMTPNECAIEHTVLTQKDWKTIISDWKNI